MHFVYICARLGAVVGFRLVLSASIVCCRSFAIELKVYFLSIT